jgi:NAD(P)-dependent dehydrogenase (short-subunit alcohol dehydrogenase family)
LTRSLAVELAPRGLRVNTLSPGAVDTERRLQAPVEFRRNAVARVPLGRAGRPDEIAAAALFLASGESSYITGVELFVDGGRSQT